MFDFTSLWVFFQERRGLLSSLLFCAIFFVIGYQIGHITSPYYSTHPIVFTDRQCDQCQSSGGSRGELEALISDPVVAGSISNQAGDQKYVGSVNSNLFHDPTCSAAQRIKKENQLWFSTVEDATVAGYSPSKCTQDKLGR